MQSDTAQDALCKVVAAGDAFMVSVTEMPIIPGQVKGQLERLYALQSECAGAYLAICDAITATETANPASYDRITTAYEAHLALAMHLGQLVDAFDKEEP
jgi:hypothetical protein